MSELVRARQESTGHVAALPAEALELGMCPGWVQVEGPAPSGPKVNAFPGDEAPDTDTAAPASRRRKKSADTSSAEEKE
ncbi:hypothetical protein [Amycolatopsis jejuensis]|uniref:hypothetical protein n=1 Tax=Amycolatopsis jejuensis TaxID=330084 RepID=UPI0005272637|nr:hypothetical protein [Amycolatopsis jejuensis]